MEIPVQPANHSGKLALLLKYPCWGRGRKKTEERRGGKGEGGRGGGKKRGGEREEDGGEHKSTLLEPLSQENICSPLSHDVISF